MRRHKRNKFKHISNVQRVIIKTLTNICDMLSEHNKELQAQVEQLQEENNNLREKLALG